MNGIKIKKEFLKDRHGFGNTNEELGKLTESEAMELLKLAYEGNDKSILNKFEDFPSEQEVNYYFDKTVLDKTKHVSEKREKHLSYFKVENFKRFESFEMYNIGQFNLIVGDNNVGKTSVLEALLVDKEANITNNNWNSLLRDNGYKLDEWENCYTILCNDERQKQNIKFWFKTSEEEPGYDNVDIFITSTSNKVYQNDMHSIFSNGVNPHLVKPYISAFHQNKQELFTVFSQISDINETYDGLLNSLKIFLPEITGISIDIPSENVKVFKVRLKNKVRTQILNAFGDGTQFAFEIMVKIFANEGKRVMIDELDTGIHYSKLKEYIRKILEMAKNSGVQLFMTTHSKECMQYYKEALDELGASYQEIARIISLNEASDKSIKAFNYDYERFSHEINLGNEIRGGY